ncbi:MAG: C1 family peptidase [Lactobacillaceae bacterium]|jgi:hypothetical protein|nr:C1 family peptidase [Lactobacillaceae bacterium]
MRKKLFLISLPLLGLFLIPNSSHADKVFTGPYPRYQNCPAITGLPDKYDPRSFILPIRNQHSFDNHHNQSICWSYAGNDMFSFSEQKHLGILNTYSPNYTNHLTAPDLYTPSVDTINNPNFDDERTSLNDGGNQAAPGVLSMLGLNPVLEHDFPSTDEHGDATSEVSTKQYSFEDFDKIKSKANNHVTVTDVNRVGAIDSPCVFNSRINELKNEIITNGAVGYSFDATQVYERTSDDQVSSWNPKTNSLFNSANDSTVAAINHATALVGFDDNYSRNNFNGNQQPTQNGAFIVRNSWGKDFGDQGYFYVSYEDYYIDANAGAASFNVQKSTQIQQDSAVSLQQTSPRGNLFYPAFPEGLEKSVDINATGNLVIASNYKHSHKALNLDAVAIDIAKKNTNYEVYLLDKIDTKQTDLGFLAFKTPILKGFEAKQGLHKKQLCHQIAIAKDQNYTLLIIQRPVDQTPISHDQAIFVSSNRSTQYLHLDESFYGFINNQNKITHWNDFSDVVTRAPHFSAHSVSPFLFAYTK